jgi:hypothetical protein
MHLNKKCNKEYREMLNKKARKRSKETTKSTNCKENVLLCKRIKWMD